MDTKPTLFAFRQQIEIQEQAADSILFNLNKDAAEKVIAYLHGLAEFDFTESGITINATVEANEADDDGYFRIDVLLDTRSLNGRRATLTAYYRADAPILLRDANSYAAEWQPDRLTRWAIAALLTSANPQAEAKRQQHARAVLGNSPAFARPIGNDGAEHSEDRIASQEQAGMTLLAYFVAHAPAQPYFNWQGTDWQDWPMSWAKEQLHRLAAQ